MVSNRRQTFKNVIVLMCKLALDGFRDLILMPLVMFAGVIDFVTGSDPQRGAMRLVKDAGRRTDSWINLFDHAEPGTDGCFDDWVGRVEQKIQRKSRRLNSGES